MKPTTGVIDASRLADILFRLIHTLYEVLEASGCRRRRWDLFSTLTAGRAHRPVERDVPELHNLAHTLRRTSAEFLQDMVRREGYRVIRWIAGEVIGHVQRKQCEV